MAEIEKPLKSTMGLQAGVVRKSNCWGSVDDGDDESHCGAGSVEFSPKVCCAILSRFLGAHWNALFMF